MCFENSFMKPKALKRRSPVRAASASSANTSCLFAGFCSAMPLYCLCWSAMHQTGMSPHLETLRMRSTGKAARRLLSRLDTVLQYVTLVYGNLYTPAGPSTGKGKCAQVSPEQVWGHQPPDQCTLPAAA